MTAAVVAAGTTQLELTAVGLVLLSTCLLLVIGKKHFSLIFFSSQIFSLDLQLQYF
jgi:hypothetical protein